MSDTAIRVENLGKRYRISGKQGRYRTLRDTLADSLTAPIRALSLLVRRGHRQNEEPAPKYEDVWALRDISFEIKAGEALGVIGRNGAGKSTLLKILSRITEPTEGVVDIYGRVVSLLEVGTGFHPELTGRENIYLNGAILGMKRTEIERKFDEIVAFADVEKYVDTPVKHYSSGMYLRLAFGVAAHLEPEILLIDEVLAVGDAAFQRKCLGKMGEVATAGRTVVFVTHDMGAMQRLCQRAIVLDNGQVSLSGTTSEAVESYMQSASPATSWQHTIDTTETEFSVLSIRLLGDSGMERNRFALGECLTVEIASIARTQLASSHVHLLVTYEGTPLFRTFDTDDFPGLLENRPASAYLYQLRLETNILKPGRYEISVDTGIQYRTPFEIFRDVLAFELYDPEVTLTAAGHIHALA